MILIRDLNMKSTNKICGIHGIYLTYWILEMRHGKSQDIFVDHEAP
jgi:hypothetical protein